MSYKLIISDLAAEQIENIISYVASEFGNPTAAIDILTDIEKSYDALEHMPESFAFCNDSYLCRKGYRKCVLSSHDFVILYRISGNEIQISGVFHTKENYINKL